MLKTKLIALVFAALFLASCASGGDEADESEAVAEVPTEAITESEEPVAQTAAAVDTDLPTATVEPTSEPPTAVPPTEALPTEAPPTTAPTATSEPADQCLACHTDKESLIETAAPEEKAPSESSGVG